MTIAEAPCPCRPRMNQPTDTWSWMYATLDQAVCAEGL
jgi:hypothetical protein